MSEPPSPSRPETDADALRRAAHLRETGDAAGAAAVYRDLVALRPAEAGLWAMLGETLRAAGDAPAGAEALEKASMLAPDNHEIAVEWAMARLEDGDPASALEVLQDRELTLLQSARGQAVLADANRLAGRPGDAIAPYRRLLALDPGNNAARAALGVCLQETGDVDGAIGQYTAVLAQEPDSAEALTNLGLAWLAQGDLDGAHAALKKAAGIESDDPETLCALGSVLQKLGRAAEAEECFQHAVESAPDDAKAWSNLGNALQDQLRLDEARAAQDRAASLAPDDADVHWNRAMTLLLAGDLEAGFAEYEWRARTKNHAPPTHDSPRWNGGDPDGKRLLLIAEQGFGDAIQFVRYAPFLQSRGAEVAIQCHARLAPLFTTLEGGPTVIPTGAALPPVDAHAPLMSLPHLLDTTLETIPADIPYLHVPKGALTPPPADTRNRIGLCWAGNPDHPDNAHRSCPFDAFGPLLARADTDWRSLQFGPAAAEARGRLADDPAWNACLDGFANTAAALQSLDLVITVDTATAHLAGALGRPVWLLLKYAPDWRWMTGRDDSPWYPTVRLFRQPAPGDWAAVIAQTDNALTQRMAT